MISRLLGQQPVNHPEILVLGTRYVDLCHDIGARSRTLDGKWKIRGNFGTLERRTRRRKGFRGEAAAARDASPANI